MERDQIGRGISCESCHGGARQWIALHYQRDITREQLTHLGMIDTKNLLVRARQCAACHVGSADQDMNHDMIAAGHPPLRFELASYEALLPRKHWDDQPQRIANPNYEVQLWAAGRVAAAQAALELLKGRALRAANQESGARSQESVIAPWPEFAESNCFACHQPLRSMAGQLAPAAERRVDMPAWQSWNIALATAVVGGGQPLAENELPPESLPAALDRLRATMQRSFEPPPAEIAGLAAAARAALQQAVSIAPDGQILDRQGRPFDTRAVLASLSAAAGSWDEACQQVAALVAVERAMRDAGQELGDGPAAELHQRIRRAAHSLRFIGSDRQWPAALAHPVSSSNSLPVTMSLAEVSRELDAIRRELLTMANKDQTGSSP